VGRVLVVNAGSSSLKLRLLDAGDGVVADHQLDAPEGRFDERELRDVVAGLDGVDAVGHRVVHGGRLTAAVRLDPDVESYLRSLVDLAPLHQPTSLAGIDLLRRLLPHAPAVACFDTAFHATLPPAASTYALPRAWRERFAIRRYGFHGLSHAYASRRAAGMLDRPGDSLRLVTCHLGAGASLAAVRGGVSVDTTMGFTPLEGLVMATRSGTVDPGLVLWLQTHQHVPAEELNERLEHGSGLKALAGSPDMREVLAGARAGSADARLALDVYLHRLRASIAAMAAATDGLDALVFTGGVGERSAEVRLAAAAGLGFLGVAVDEAGNAGARPDAEVSRPGAAVRVLVIEAREDLEVARQVREVLRQDERPGDRPARRG
jgi:acetate kinase